ncbi:MAG: thiamine pyrophosphate-dependent dehydrogenase E1 component subunit alpha [Betaproteobacteria bacterium]|nr:thiamine pyrophosphate-dependent dehydrogenase E1 component subunit alpha [Betaproteobacteria bacterium]
MSNRNETWIALHRLMLATRELDRVIGAADGHWHPALGEEAVVAGCYHGLRQGDALVPHYRGMIAASYARGGDLARLLAGLEGKATSYTRGRYRSDVCGPIEFGIIGLYSGALGPTLEYAAGAALAAKLDARGGVALAVFGDGTASRGNFHEALNLAAVLCLPVVFVCQNNQFAISTSSAREHGGRIVDRAAGFGVPGQLVDGNDVVAVHDAVQGAIARARRGEGPALIDAFTYRVGGHMASDPGNYRSSEEVEKWKARDPIALHEARLLSEGVLDAAKIAELRAAVSAEVEAAMRKAQSDPMPGPEVLGLDRVFAGGV